MNYQRLYLKIFNAVSDALEALEQQNVGQAKELLRRAQQETEELYMEEEE